MVHISGARKIPGKGGRKTKQYHGATAMPGAEMVSQAPCDVVLAHSKQHHEFAFPSFSLTLTITLIPEQVRTQSGNQAISKFGLQTPNLSSSADQRSQQNYLV